MEQLSIGSELTEAQLKLLAQVDALEKAGRESVQFADLRPGRKNPLGFLTMTPKVPI